MKKKIINKIIDIYFARRGVKKKKYKLTDGTYVKDYSFHVYYLADTMFGMLISFIALCILMPTLILIPISIGMEYGFNVTNIIGTVLIGVAIVGFLVFMYRQTAYLIPDKLKEDFFFNHEIVKDSWFCNRKKTKICFRFKGGKIKKIKYRS